MKTSKNSILIVLLLLVNITFAQKGPQFEKGEDPRPSNSKWKLVKGMSDEFKGKKLNEKKWQISGQGWIGRDPGLFLPSNVNVYKGNLEITATKMPKTIMKHNKEFTHGGGYVGSREAMTYGYYECEMKANKTFMSSTFWLINNSKKSKGCDKRTTELDIQETVGQITSDKKFAIGADQRMGSNTHSRGIQEGCDIPTKSKGANTEMDGKTHDDFHIYGVWWKNKNEVLYFLDGKLVQKVTPPSDFNLPMYLRMVVETYHWNPVPADGGMTGSKADRTTTYKWVRAWQLVE